MLTVLIGSFYQNSTGNDIFIKYGTERRNEWLQVQWLQLWLPFLSTADTSTMLQMHLRTSTATVLIVLYCNSCAIQIVVYRVAPYPI